MHTLKTIVSVVILLQLIFPSSSMVSAQQKIEHKKFYVGFETGLGFLKLSRDGFSSDSKARFALGIYGGYAPTNWLRVGINANGWLKESGNLNDPSKGISVSNIYGQIEVFPFETFNLFVNLQGGQSRYINNHPDEFNASGTGYKIGLGYEHDLGKHLFNSTIGKHLGLSLTMNYGAGRFKDVNKPLLDISVTDQHYEVFEFMLGLTYR